MTSAQPSTAIIVTAAQDQPTCAELEAQAEAGERPRKDYVELAKVLDADVIDYTFASQEAVPIARTLTRRVSRQAGQLAHAVLARKRYQRVLVWSDQLGILMALINKATRAKTDLTLISVWLSNWKKSFPIKWLRAHSAMRAIINYGSSQMEIAHEELGVPREKLYHLLQPVDDRFWCPDDTIKPEVVSVIGGTYPHHHQTARDFATLFAATNEIDASFELAVGSNLTRDAVDSNVSRDEVIRRFIGQPLPSNVTLDHYRPRELRAMLARSFFTVIPLKDVDFDAGVTAITEAMAMGKAVITTRNRGQVDVVRDGETGMYVPPGNPDALREAIQYLLDNPEEARRMGRAGRKLAEERHSLDGYTQRLANIVRGTDTRTSVPV